jgi:hypothetical protein
VYEDVASYPAGIRRDVFLETEPEELILDGLGIAV